MSNAFYEQQKTCPVCETSFKVTRVRSSACYVLERETDFHVKYRDIDPLLYSIWVCPNCQYANTDKEFNELRPAEREKLKKGLPKQESEKLDFSGQRTPQLAFKAVELAIRSAVIRQAPAIILAGLFLRAAWLHRDLGNTEAEIKFLEQSKKLYQYSFEKEDNKLTARMSDAHIMYLIGELNRRLGNYEDAVSWFSRTIMSNSIKNHPEINRMARSQWEIAREEFKKQQKSGSNNKTDSNEEEPAVIPENSVTEKPNTDNILNTSKMQSRGSKVKMFVNLYMDQVDWLKKVTNNVYDKHKVFIEREVVIRAMLDAFIEKSPELGNFKSEEELKEWFITKINN